MTQPQVAIALTADDRTARGLNSAEKRAAATVRRIGKGSEAQASSLARGTRGLLGTVVKMEQATSKLFGGTSLTGGVTSKLGSIGEAAGVARTGMLGAAEAGGVFEGALVGMAGAAAVTVGTVAAVAAGMYKLADGWGKGANELGNLSSLIGVSTKGLQEFAGAAERVGVSKDVATGAVGSLSQTLNDARYGRNTAALAVLAKMGVKLQTNQDGTVNVEAMLPALANALQGQNSSGRRTAARALGIPEAALAAFTQGGSKLGASMTDYGRNGAMMSDDDTKLGRSLTERDVALEQRAGKAWLSAQRANATIVKGAGDKIAEGADAVSKMGAPSLIGSADAQTFAPAGDSDGWGMAAGGAFARDRIRRDRRWRSGGAMGASRVDLLARRARSAFRRNIRNGMSPEEAAAWAANGEVESGNNSHSRQIGGGPGRGTYQWGADRPAYDRRPVYARVIGKAAGTGSADDDERFRAWEVSHTYRRAQRAIDAASTAAGKSEAVTRYYEVPGKMAQNVADRANIAEQIIKLEIEFHNPPDSGVSARASAGGRNRPAISLAQSHH